MSRQFPGKIVRQLRNAAEGRIVLLDGGNLGTGIFPTLFVAASGLVGSAINITLPPPTALLSSILLDGGLLPMSRTFVTSVVIDYNQSHSIGSTPDIITGDDLDAKTAGITVAVFTDVS